MNVLKLAQNSRYFYGFGSLSSIQSVAEDEVAGGVATGAAGREKTKWIKMII